MSEMKNIDNGYLSGAYEAQEIYTKLTVAFYMKATAPGVAHEHYTEAHEKFLQLASKLGYRVEKFSPSEPIDPRTVRAALEEVA